MRMDWLLLMLNFITCCTVLFCEGLYLQKLEANDNQQSKTENLAVHNVELNGSSTLETVSPHESKIKEEDTTKLGHGKFCDLCICDRPFDLNCISLCCNNSSSNESPPKAVNSQETAFSPDITAKKDHNVNQDHQQNDPRTNFQTIDGHKEVDAKKVSEEDHSDPEREIAQADAESQLGSGRPKPEILLPSNHKNSGPDASGMESPDPALISTVESSSKSWNIIFVLSSAALIIIVLFLFIKQWRRKQVREAYLPFGRCSEFRPSSLSDVLNEHSD